MLKRRLAGSSGNPLKDTLGAVDDIVAMTDRVIEIRLRAPRPNLLQLLAQPEFAFVRNGAGSGPFSIAAKASQAASCALTREIVIGRRRGSREREEVLLAAATAARGGPQLSPPARPTWCSAGRSPTCRFARASSCRGAALHFDPASGPVRPGPGAHGRPD